ncbi:MAG: hypothetical protein LBV47_06330 [Bacteroidales bacterium]|jgi:hypothetical protein|nr:hypothetical protein [Bacteroidales bacterium]
MDCFLLRKLAVRNYETGNYANEGEIAFAELRNHREVFQGRVQKKLINSK